MADKAVQTEWNLNAGKLPLIAKNLEEGTNAFAVKGYSRCFASWKGIRMMISNRLTKKELIKSMAFEKTIPKKQSKVKNTINTYAPNEDYVFYLEKYIHHVNVLLKKYGMDLSDKVVDMF